MVIKTTVKYLDNTSKKEKKFEEISINLVVDRDI